MIHDPNTEQGGAIGSELGSHQNAAARLDAAAAALTQIAHGIRAGSASSAEIDLVVADIVGAQREHFGAKRRAPHGQGARGKLLTYFKAHVGEEIDGEQLRLVSGIGEWARRVRELRVEEGYDIEQVATSTYIMHRAEPDEERAAQWQLANAIRSQPGGAMARIEAFFTANVGEVVTRDRLDYVAKIKEGSRRVRELRDEAGWPINSHIDERELSAGEYRLVSTAMEDRRDPLQRDYSENLREEVFARDGYTCQQCERNREAATKAGDQRFYLELHHRVAIADELAALPKAERNDPANLVTLCHSCHNAETAKLKHAKLAERRSND